MSIYQRFFEDSNTVEPRVAGLYDLGPTIGRGHYAVVRSARHVFTGEKVAVKVIDKTKLDAHSREHLFQEVVCMKLVQHPNVVRLYEVIDTVNKLYLILELGDGGDLYDYIMKHEQGLCEKLAKRYFRQIVTAIAYCHNLHVVHRDLKPENVVFFEQLGVVKLTDFGFSYQFVPGKQLDTFCGSLAYSAPEILLGTKYDAPKVDIWSLGVILFMLVCGRLPFEEANDSETLTKIMDCEYQLPPHLSPECSSLISRLLIRDPSKRATLDEVLQDEWLQVATEELPIGLFSVPLISQEHLVFEDHMEILNKMASGGLATVDEIQQALDRNEYSHISATYFLLAERKLKRNYIEEYKLLSAQAKVIEQSLLNLASKPESVASAPVPPASRPNTALPMSISASLAASGAEERLRRFSMILEDEEENEDVLECFAPHHHLPEDFAIHEEALLDEEEEELEAVASLACVRSELLSEQERATNTAIAAANSADRCEVSAGGGGDLNGLVDFEIPPATTTTRYFTRPNSRLDLSDRATSETSLTGGGAAAGDAGRRSISSLVMFSTSSARPGRPLPRLRPLISVKSSPQLLKYIAEEEDGELSSMKPLPVLIPRQTRQTGRKSLSSIYANRSSMPRARSPPWSGRRVQATSLASFSANTSRPLSGINFVAAAAATDRKLRAPNALVQSTNFFLASRHTPNSYLRPIVAQMSSSTREHRRRSGPPCLSLLLGSTQMNTNNPAAHLNLQRGGAFNSSNLANSERETTSSNAPVDRAPSPSLPDNNGSSKGRFSLSCQSAPNILDHLLIKPSGGTEVCAPIREEEDENKTYSPSKDELGDTRQQEPQSPHSPPPASKASSPVVPNGPRLSYVHLRASTLRQQQPQQNGLTASNFSLASFASSLRESRHMMDVVRGTYELQMQSKRRTGLPRLTGGSSFEGLPPAPSASIVVPTEASYPLNRSLTLINQPGQQSVSANASLRRPRVAAVTTPALRQLSASPPPRNATAPSASAFETKSIANGEIGGARYAASSASSDSGMPIVNFGLPGSNSTFHKADGAYSSPSQQPPLHLLPPPTIPEEKSLHGKRFFALSMAGVKLKPLCDGGNKSHFESGDAARGGGGGGGGSFRRRRGRRKSKGEESHERASVACCHIS